MHDQYSLKNKKIKHNHRLIVILAKLMRAKNHRHHTNHRKKRVKKKKSPHVFTGHPRLFQFKSLPSSLKLLHTLLLVHTHALFLSLSLFLRKRKKEVRNVKGLYIYRHALPKVRPSPKLDPPPVSAFPAPTLLLRIILLTNLCGCSELKLFGVCQWIRALVQASLTSKGYPPMVEATFSTMCTATSLRFPASTPHLYGPLGEALMGLFGKSFSSLGSTSFSFFFLLAIVWVRLQLLLEAKSCFFLFIS